jgi:hypothetical protein
MQVPEVSGPRIFAPLMFNNELDMLRCHLEAFEGYDVTTVLVESYYTHRAVPKPLAFAANRERFAGHDIRHVIDDWDPDPVAPWVNEHVQRKAAWKITDAEADDDDVVIIADCDEIPSRQLLDFLPLWASAGGRYPLSVRMRTYLFAVDWQVPDPLPSGRPLPPTCVVATVRYLRERAACGEYLGEVRDGRGNYPEFSGFGGWHFSWLGGPERQKEKLETSTCHGEILRTPEAELIRSGARWRSQEDGGGLPVVPVEVDETYPAYIREGRCPKSWRRPREAAA